MSAAATPDAAAKRLPEGFAELEPFLDWSLPTERLRHGRRLTSDMQSIRAFYDAMFPRMSNIAKYLNTFPLDQMPAEAERLFHLSLAFVEASSAAETFGSPTVPDGFDAARFVPIE